ncbi:monooxygenase [Nonomuraea soli]|uniref:Copper type II ascorbate-dependent monooxygenase C-terminal domain-containing protein n=1 Tax=Nonomuraea soli TaxID=1032476 RepID=A0A7W0HV19_9ACTN|nr:monooxygenase [Nonomuraea soli]MBA2896321.1 hypothetical protein [Nonomuraea soli]
MRRIAIGAAGLLVTALLAACGGTASTTAHGGGHSAGGSPPASTHGGLHSASPTPPAAALRTGESFVTLTMAEPYTPRPTGGGTDEYRCFLIDPKITEPGTYLAGTQFLPGNGDVVHHAIFFRADKVGQARKLDAESPDPGWTCFGDAGVDGDWIGHWAPGTNEVLLDPKLGYPMAPGSMLIMQVHYSTLALGGKEPGSDRSGVRMRMATGQRTPLSTALFAAPVELPCTDAEKGPLCSREAAVADVGKRFGEQSLAQVQQLSEWCDGDKPVAGATQSCTVPVEQPATIHALAGHMHLLGRSIKVELNGETLLDVPQYNFDNQALQPLDEPVAVKKGDKITVTCTHDAGLRAQLPVLKDLPPRYVVWGEGTQDEMCLGIVVVS